MAFSDYGSVISSGIGAVMGGIQTKAQSDISKREAEQAQKNNETQLALAQLGLETAKVKAGANSVKPQKSNTVLYVTLGIGGVLVLGVVIYAVTKK